MSEFKKFLVPMDFSEPSTTALSYGLALATRFHGKLILAHIVPGSASLSYAFPVEAFAIEKDQYDKALKEMKALVASDRLAKLEVRTVVKVGRIEEELLGIVQDESVDLVVLGSHGRRSPARWFIGSVTEHLLRRVPVPVLTVSHIDKDIEMRRSGISIKRMLYATDFGDSSSAGMKYAVDFAERVGAELTVMSVVEYLGMAYRAAAYLENERAQRLAEMRKQLDEFVARETLPGMNVTTIVVDGKPYEQILAAAQTNRADCIVLNLQSKSVIERAFLGSTAERVVRLAHVPVLGIPFTARTQTS
jgi:nucleotide-binding universal stress UspA family protein